MNEERIEQQLDQALSSITPNVLDAVLNNIEKEMNDMTKTNVEVTPMKKTNTKLKKFYAPFVGLAACAVVVAGLGSQGLFGGASNDIYSTIGIDVNPSIELDLSKSEKVVEVDALNEDGKKVIAGMDLKGSDANVALNAILGAMVKQGYITDLDSEVLITVDSKDQEMVIALEDKLVASIEDTLKSQNIDPKVVSQKINSDTQTVSKLADNLNLSKGAANLLLNLTETHDPENAKNISTMTKEELRIYFDGLIDVLEDKYDDSTEIGEQLDQLDDYFDDDMDDDNNDNDLDDDLNDNDDDDVDDDVDDDIIDDDVDDVVDYDDSDDDDDYDDDSDYDDINDDYDDDIDYDDSDDDDDDDYDDDTDYDDSDDDDSDDLDD